MRFSHGRGEGLAFSPDGKELALLLDSMDRRAQLQLRLQETVEGLSVAAITYYIVSLVGKAAEGMEREGLHVDPAVAMGVAIPVVAGLVAAPVIAVPTSTGYGSSFGGLTALLAMLNSCSSNVSVVNIDNGFGAGCVAGVINRL